MVNIKRLPGTTNIKIKVRTMQAILRMLADRPLPESADNSDVSYQYYTHIGLNAKKAFDDAQNMRTPTYRRPHIRTKIYNNTYDKLFDYYAAQLDHPDYHLFGQITYQIISPLLDPNRIQLIESLKQELSQNKQLAPAPSVERALDFNIVTHEYITTIRTSILDEAARYSPEDADYLPLIDRRIVAKLRRDFLQNDSPLIQMIYEDAPPSATPAIQAMQVISYIPKQAVVTPFPDIMRYRTVWYQCVQITKYHSTETALCNHVLDIMIFINVSLQIAIEQLQDY